MPSCGRCAVGAGLERRLRAEMLEVTRQIDAVTLRFWAEGLDYTVGVEGSRTRLDLVAGSSIPSGSTVTSPPPRRYGMLRYSAKL